MSAEGVREAVLASSLARMREDLEDACWQRDRYREERDALDARLGEVEGDLRDALRTLRAVNDQLAQLTGGHHVRHDPRPSPQG